MIKNEIREEIKSRSTGIGKVFVDLLFGVWSMIGTLVFLWIVDRFTGTGNDNNTDH